MLETNYSYGFERDEEQLKRNDGDFRKWSNPLEVRLCYCHCEILTFGLTWVVMKGYLTRRL